jgi:phage head maturation protease
MQKTFKFELKDIGDAGTFVGMASVYGNKDLGGDVVEAGAFTKTLNDKNGEVPILWQHDMREPIGMGKLTDSADGLQIKGELALESPVAQKAHALLKKGVLKGLVDRIRHHPRRGEGQSPLSQGIEAVGSVHCDFPHE